MKSLGVDSVTFNLPLFFTDELSFLDVEFNSNFTGYQSFIMDFSNFKLDEFLIRVNLLKKIYDRDKFIQYSQQAILDNESLQSKYFQRDYLLTEMNGECTLTDAIVLDNTGNLLVCPDFTSTVISSIKESTIQETLVDRKNI